MTTIRALDVGMTRTCLRDHVRARAHNSRLGVLVATGAALFLTTSLHYMNLSHNQVRIPSAHTPGSVHELCGVMCEGWGLLCVFGAGCVLCLRTPPPLSGLTSPLSVPRFCPNSSNVL